MGYKVRARTGWQSIALVVASNTLLFSPGDQALLSLLVPRQWLTLITGIYYPIFKAGKNYLLPQTTATVFWN